jgi:hypothetical protein
MTENMPSSSKLRFLENLDSKGFHKSPLKTFKPCIISPISKKGMEMVEKSFKFNDVVSKKICFPHLDMLSKRKSQQSCQEQEPELGKKAKNKGGKPEKE